VRDVYIHRKTGAHSEGNAAKEYSAFIERYLVGMHRENYSKVIGRNEWIAKCYRKNDHAQNDIRWKTTLQTPTPKTISEWNNAV
jgi:hypothetical protein